MIVDRWWNSCHKENEIRVTECGKTFVVEVENEVPASIKFVKVLRPELHLFSVLLRFPNFSQKKNSFEASL